MQDLNRTLMVTIAVVIAFAATAAAQVGVVVGTGDPNIDVPAVQAAVDQGGFVTLIGHLSFDRPPTRPAGATYSRMVTVSKEVVITGNRDEHAELPTIEAGFIPFLVEAPGARVVLQGLHFLRPKGAAIWVYAASGLAITLCRIEAVEASVEFASYAEVANPLADAIFVSSIGPPPTAVNPGQPENFSGTLLILSNDIDVGGTSGENTLGIAVFSVGQSPDKQVDLYISGNTIRNTTRRAMELHHIGGRVHIERNVITTGAIQAPIAGVSSDAMRVVGSGSYLVAHNSINCAWPIATGIRVHGNPPLGDVIARAIVVDNDVTMSPPEGTVFGDLSAGIDIRGFAQGNVVLNNRIRGRGRAALAVTAQGAGFPGNNAFISNDLTGFQSSLADVYVDAGVTNTLVIGTQNSVEDHGDGTLIVPVPFSDE